MPATLIIVDMQANFSAANDPNVAVYIAQEIISAKRQRAPIILLEYEGCPPTHPALSALLRGYRHKAKVTKSGDDGSKELVRAMKRRSFNNRHLRVCGVNTDCCVYATVEGLLRRLKKVKIEVIKRACNASYRSWDGWSIFKENSNLTLV